MNNLNVLPGIFVLPKGRLMWAKVREPDYRFNTFGTYSVDIQYTDVGWDRKVLKAKESQGTVDEFIAEHLKASAAFAEENCTVAKGMTPEYQEIVPVNESEDEEYGHLFTLRAKTTASWKDKRTNELQTKEIKIVDRQLQTIPKEVLIGNGSIGCIACQVAYWFMKQKADRQNKSIPVEYGMSFYLQSLQVLTLIEYQGENSFEVVDKEDDPDDGEF